MKKIKILSGIILSIAAISTVVAQTNINPIFYTNNDSNFKFLELYNDKIIKNITKADSKNIEIDILKNIKNGEIKSIIMKNSTNNKIVLNDKIIKTTDELEEWKHLAEVEICWEKIPEIKINMDLTIHHGVFIEDKE